MLSYFMNPVQMTAKSSDLAFIMFFLFFLFFLLAPSHPQEKLSSSFHSKESFNICSLISYVWTVNYLTSNSIIYKCGPCV